MGKRGTLVGRDLEVTTLVRFLDEAVPGALVLTGEAGRGKTALLEHAVALATERDALVFQATPGEGEEHYSFGVLQDLFREIRLDDLALRGPVEDALTAVLLRGPASGRPDGQVVSVGVHDVLVRLSEQRRVVVSIDDAQWADPASMEALTYAARRLGQAPVQFVLTRRAGYPRTGLEAALVRGALRDVEPRLLTVEETARLLSQELSLTLSPRVLRTVHDQSRGNPLFVLEIGRVLDARGAPGVGEPLGIPNEMAEVLGLRVRDLPEGQRTVLLAVALDPQLTETDLGALVGERTVRASVRDRVIAIASGGRARAWHPLLAAAAREDSTPAERHDVHHRLAEIVQGTERRVRHRALVSEDPVEALAAALSDAAALAGDRGAAETALELAELALARTPAESPNRVARVLDLASRMAMANEAQRLTEFLEAEIEALPHGPERGRALLMLLDGMWGTVAHVEAVVERALAECGGDPQVRGQALDAKSFIAGGIKVSGVAQARAWAEEAIALGAGREDGRLISDALSWCLVHAGHPPEPAEGPPHWKRLIWRGELASAEREVRRAISAAEELGRFQEAASLLVSLSDVLVRSGRIEEARAFAAAQEDLDLAAREGPDLELLMAEIEARYGDVGATRDWALLARQGALRLGHVWIELEIERALALAALQSGEPEEAERRLRRVFQHTVAAGVREPGMFPVAPELVEALVHLGRYDEARSVLDWLVEVSTEQDHPWGRLMVRRSRLLVGLFDGSLTPGESSTSAVEVVHDLVALGVVHDAARTQLVVGSALRRHRQWGLAREHLLQAAEIFDGLGAMGWAETARSELARVGGRRPAADGELTEAELEVARLAADGLANKQIARQLHVTVSTVETQLTRAYAKLGVRSRAQLNARLDELRAATEDA